jgi:hypothetical protein
MTAAYGQTQTLRFQDVEATECARCDNLFEHLIQQAQPNGIAPTLAIKAKAASLYRFSVMPATKGDAPVAVSKLTAVMSLASIRPPAAINVLSRRISLSDSKST